MYVYIGWFNVAAIVIMTSPYWLRFLNKHIFKTKSPVYSSTIKTMRAIHKPLGVAILILAIIHGILALGALRLHTGTILGGMLIITATLGILFFRLKKRELFVWHKRAVAVLILLVLVHLIFPSAMYYLFGV